MAIERYSLLAFLVGSLAPYVFDDNGNPIPLVTTSATPIAVTQANWYVDPQNSSGLASDNNDGSSATKPLLTGAALFAKTGGNSAVWVNGTNYNFYIMSNSTAPDYIMIGGMRQPTAGFNFHGGSVAGQAPAANLLFSGTLSAATNTNAGANTRPTVTDGDGGFDWNTSGPGGTSLISTNSAPNKRCRLTSGANSGSYFFATKRISASQAAVSQLMTQITLTGLQTSTSGSIATFTGNETFVVESLVHVDIFLINVVPGGGGAGGVNNAVVDSLDFTGGKCSSSVRCIWNGCTGLAGLTVYVPVGGNAGNQTILSSQCGGTLAGGSFANVYACHVTAALGTLGGIVRTSFNTIAQGCPLFDPTSQQFACNALQIATSGGAAAFDSTSFGVFVVDADSFTGALLWGSGNTTFGLSVASAGAFRYESIPVITGTSGNFDLGGATSGRAWNEGGSAFTALISNTWTLLGTAIGSAGFGGNAQNVGNGAKIVARVTN